MNDMSIVLMDKSVTHTTLHNGGIVELKLDIFGESIPFRFRYKDEPATLLDIAHVAKSLSERINPIVQRKVYESGFAIPCGAGCAACCCFLILLSPPETIRLVEEIAMKMPIKQRKDLIQSYGEVAKRTFGQLPKHLIPKNADNVSNSEIRDISNWYTALQQPCLFLRNDSCSIYTQRPIVCRDFLVTGTSSHCQVGTAGVPFAVEMPLKLGDVLRRLVGELEGVTQKGIFLHDIFTWYEANKELRERTWPARMLVESLVEIIHETSKSKPYSPAS